jgi:hypothetical protein
MQAVILVSFVQTILLDYFLFLSINLTIKTTIQSVKLHLVHSHGPWQCKYVWNFVTKRCMKGFGIIDATLSIWLIQIRNKISAVNLLPRNKWNKYATVDRPKGRGKGTLTHDPPPAPRPPGTAAWSCCRRCLPLSSPSGRDENYPPTPIANWDEISPPPCPRRDRPVPATYSLNVNAAR